MNDAEKEALAANLREGLASAAQLASATEELTEVLEQVEDTLAELRLGVRASVPLTPDRVLSFERQSRMWRLVITGPGYETLLINASREVRMLAASRLNLLVAAMANEAAKMITEVRQAKGEAQEYLAALRAFITQHVKKEPRDGE